MQTFRERFTLFLTAAAYLLFHLRLGPSAESIVTGTVAQLLTTVPYCIGFTWILVVIVRFLHKGNDLPGTGSPGFSSPSALSSPSILPYTNVINRCFRGRERGNKNRPSLLSALNDKEFNKKYLPHYAGQAQGACPYMYRKRETCFLDAAVGTTGVRSVIPGRYASKPLFKKA